MHFLLQVLVMCVSLHCHHYYEILITITVQSGALILCINLFCMHATSDWEHTYYALKRDTV